MKWLNIKISNLSYYLHQLIQRSYNRLQTGFIYSQVMRMLQECKKTAIKVYRHSSKVQAIWTNIADTRLRLTVGAMQAQAFSSKTQMSTQDCSLLTCTSEYIHVDCRTKTDRRAYLVRVLGALAAVQRVEHVLDGTQKDVWDECCDGDEEKDEPDVRTAEHRLEGAVHYQRAGQERPAHQRSSLIFNH